MAERAKKLHIPSVVLSVIGLLFALLLPIITYACSIPALVMSLRRRGTHKTTAVIVICAVGLAAAAVNSIWGAYLALQ